jgi:MtrB/PioB family decaheme-associated outer membrane protein
MLNRHTLRTALLASICLIPVYAAQAQEPLFEVEDNPAAKKAAPIPDNYLDAGVNYQSSKSFKFGQYTGLTDQGGTAIGGFLVGHRDDWDSGDTTFWQLQGRDLGLDSRSFDAVYAKQGSWSAKVWYDGIPFHQDDAFKTVYDPSATGALANGLTIGSLVAPVNPLNFPTCPAGTATKTSQICTVAQPSPATAANEANWPSVANQLSTQDVKLQRDRFGGDFSYRDGDWTFSGTLSHEHKEGTKENSMVFNATSLAYPNMASTAIKLANGNYTYIPGNLTTNLVYFPEPVNYDNDRYVVKAAYNTKRFQAQFTYTFNNFTDNKSNFAGQDPFQTLLFAGGATPAATSLAGMVAPYGLTPSVWTPQALAAGQSAPFYVPLTAAYSLPPSNSAHQFKAQAAYNLTSDTRISGTFQYGVNYQDMAFNPVSNTPAINALTPPAIYGGNLGSSLNGLAENWFGNLQVTTRPFAGFNVRAAFTVDDRDNLTSSRSYASVVTDGVQNDGNAVINSLPYRFLKEKAVIEVGYMLAPETKVTLSDTYTVKDSKYLTIDRNTENAADVKLASALLTGLDLTAGYTHSVRTANMPGCTQVNATTCTYNLAPWLAFGGLSNHPDTPGFVPYSEAARTRDAVRDTLDWTPSNGLNLDLTTSAATDHYPTNTFGVKNDMQVEVSPSIGYMPSKALSYRMFYSFMQSYQGAAFNQVGNPIWTAKTTDTSHTFGVSGNWKVSDDLKLSADYSFSYGDTNILTADGLFGTINSANNCVATGLSCSNALSFYNLSALPDTKNTLNRVRLSGEYSFTPAMALWMGYTYQKLSSSDWTYSQAAVSPLYYNFVLNGDPNPSYTVHLISAALKYRF